MVLDRAGNTLKTARKITLKSTSSLFKDSITSTDRVDLYKFTLNARSSLGVAMSGLRSNLDLRILNAQGKVLKQSARSGTQSEAIRQEFAPGTYYIRVYRRSGTTSYKLSASATPVPTSSPSPSPTSTFNIQFDYRFDTNGWFTAERRAVLESAANVWENIIQDEFENVPVGTELSVVNPQTNTSQSLTSDTEIDDLVIFVGSRNIDGNGGTLAVGGTSGVWFLGSSLETRFTGSNFEPWTGYLAVDSTESWFFDSTPSTSSDIPSNQEDFFSIMLHELGHTLGIGTSDAYNNLIQGGFFTGTNAKNRNGGNPIPLTGDGHIQDDFIASGVSTEAAMDPTLLTGSRKLPNNLDIALLDDIGYQVVYR
ncbi:MAG TPA: pre-peptidase C-terminal domain-containing protein [Chroococcidiopsis sp.]